MKNKNKMSLEEQEYYEFQKLVQEQKLQFDEYCKIMKSFMLTVSTNN